MVGVNGAWISSLSLAGVLVVIVLALLLRSLIRRGEDGLRPWQSMRVGVFVERERFRDNDDDDTTTD